MADAPTSSQSPPAPAAPKSCRICGIDVSTKRRTKDANGKYVCEPCMENAQNAAVALKNPPKPAPAGAAKVAGASDDDNSFLLQLGGNAQALSGGKECPKCARVANVNDQLCLACGYNFTAGKVVRTRIEVAPRDGTSSGTKWCPVWL
jgi:hypothetical protein